MRRTLSVILFILGGWLLTSEVMVSWINVGEPSGTAFAMVGIMLVLSAPLLALGTWASPGNRLADLGITMVICAGIGGGCALSAFMMLSDPKFLMLLPLESPARDLHLAAIPGGVNLIVIAAVGWFLWSTGRRREKRRTAEIGRVFSDE